MDILVISILYHIWRTQLKYNLLVFIVVLLSLSLTPFEKKNNLSKEDFFKQLIGNEEVVETVFFLNQKYNYDEELILALIKNESQFKKFAVGKNKKDNVVVSIDQGLMQLNSKYFKNPNIYDPMVNICQGISYFDDCVKKGETVEKAIMRYNSGQDKYYVSFKMKKYVNDTMDDYMDYCKKWKEYESNIE